MDTRASARRGVGLFEFPDAEAGPSVVFRRTQRQLVAEAALFPVLGGTFGLLAAALGWSTFSFGPALVVGMAAFVVASAAATAWWIGHERVEFTTDQVIVVTRFARAEIPWSEVAEIRQVKVAGGWYPQVVRRDPAAKPQRAAVPNTSFGAFVDPDFDTKIAQMEVQRLAAAARRVAAVAR